MRRLVLVLAKSRATPPDRCERPAVDVSGRRLAALAGGERGPRLLHVRRPEQHLCLDVAGSSPAPGADVQVWTCNNLQPQIWRLERH
ncbi:RICIN domain-containing protein [Kribbella sp. NPDC050241]|uniref:RICIN domain-containing protein n=1 Tax=Kribbella sp. NPDC050241 TaxID=3364115 RepID=UPI0037B463A2